MLRVPTAIRAEVDISARYRLVKLFLYLYSSGMSPDNNSHEVLHSFALKGSVTAGLTALALLPIGSVSAPASPLFLAVTWVHIALLLISAGILTSALWLVLRHRRQRTALLLIGALFSGYIAREAYLPIIARDALSHHLAVPSWWVALGRVVPISWHEWSFYPMLQQLVYTSFIAAGDAWAAVPHHAIYLWMLSVSVSLFLYTRSRSALIALASFALLVTTPVCLRLAASPLVDLALAYYCWAAFAIFLGGQGGGWAGAALGLALGTKYNAIPAVLFLVILFPLAGTGDPRNRRQMPALVSTLVAAFTALLVFLPWAARNYMSTGNPVFPLYDSAITGRAGTSGPSLSPLEHRAALYGESGIDLLAAPLRMLLNGADDDPRRFDGVASPVYLAVLVGLFAAAVLPWGRVAALYITGYFITALFTASWRLRYLAPLYGFICLLALWPVACLKNQLWRNSILSGLIAMHLLFTGIYMYHATAQREFFTYNGDEAAYLRRHIPGYPLIEYVNSKLPADSRVYLLYTGNQFYYFRRNVYSGGHFSERPIAAWVESSGSPEKLRERFRDYGITHLLADRERSAAGLAAHFGSEETSLWNEFQHRYLKALVGSGRYTLFEVS